MANKPDPRINVRFTRNWSNYMAGERAGFRPALAADLIKKGVAIITPQTDDTVAHPAGQSAAVGEDLKTR